VSFAMHYVYILFSKKLNSLYTGSTSNLDKRFKEHNAGRSRYTKSGTPWVLVFYAAFQSKNKALNFETYLKSGSGKAFKYKRLVSDDIKLRDPKLQRRTS